MAHVPEDQPDGRHVSIVGSGGGGETEIEVGSGKTGDLGGQKGEGEEEGL